MKRIISTTILSFLCVISALAQNSITDTYWRNVNTGDWVLGVAEDAVIYDCKIWDVTSRTEKKDAYVINATDGNNTITINLGKEKKGQRVMTIGKEKMVCEPLTSFYMPDYPIKDENPQFVNNNYVDGDSVTIVGWLRNMPQHFKDEDNNFSVYFQCLHNDEEVTYKAPLDDEGRFTLRFPVENTITIYSERQRGPVMVPVEPNETYFLLKDFNGRVYFMGKNARLQNEIFAAFQSKKIEFDHGNYQKSREYGGFNENYAYLDSLKDEAMTRLEQYFAEHPNVSERFKTFWRNEVYTEIGSTMMQTRFMLSREMIVPEDFLDLVTRNYWNKIEEPRIMNSTFNCFFRDYFDCLERHELKKVSNHLRWGFYEGERDGIVEISDEDKQFIDYYIADMKAFETRLFAAPEEERQTMIEEYNAGETVKKMEALVARENVNEGLNQELNLMGYKLMKQAADSLSWSPALYSRFLSQFLYRAINDNREPLRQFILDYGDKYITSEVAKKMIHELHDKYLAITKRQFNENILKSSDVVEGLSEGEQIIKKLIEPHHGHYVLVDFWGTWCGPCKEALSHSQEEYEKLAPYDMVFMYLANRSEELEGWKNVIKEYQVTGENVVHYNLPRAQQTAIEQYLNVHAFPSYFLFDKEGNLMSVNADPRDLDAFARMMKRLIE